MTSLLLASFFTMVAGEVRVAPAPAGEPLSKLFTVSVQGKKAPVYITRVAARDEARRNAAMDDPARAAETYDEAAFASFDMTGTVTVAVGSPETIRSVKILPTSAGVVARVRGKTVSFTMRKPQPLTIEINGEWCSSLHLFANPYEKEVPKKNDPNVIFFGPGIHEVGHTLVGDGKTVYVAPGAVVRCVVKPDEKGWTYDNGRKGYPPSFELIGKNMTVRGRGIIDASRVPYHMRNIIGIKGQDVRLEGVILRDAATWTVPIRQSDRVWVENLKILGYRANSDGIDVCNSRDVSIEGGFLRTLDDLIVVKADKNQGEVARVSARGVVLWNQMAHALSLGAELRENVTDVSFRDCDVIHDKGREWTLRVFQCDSSRISNTRFENIRVEESRRLASLWIGETSWTRDAQRGHIDDVVFRDIQVADSAPKIELVGYDAAHLVKGVAFERVLLDRKPLTSSDVKANPFVQDLRILP